MNDCKFCDPKILEHQSFFENKGALALVCFAPICPGHSLVISKKHACQMLDLEEKDVREVIGLVYQVKKILRAVFHTDCFTDVLQDGPYAHQTLPHLHYHIYPRTEGDFTREQFYGLTLSRSRVDWQKGKGLLTPEQIEETRQLYIEAARSLDMIQRDSKVCP